MLFLESCDTFIRHQFIAFLFYRWEVIQRETVILGLLGVHTLGFYVDSAFEELRFDRAIVLIVVTAALNIALDAFTSRMRRKLDLPTISEQL
jgi:phosphonate transport system permease protein